MLKLSKIIITVIIFFLFACSNDDNVTRQPKFHKRMIEDSLRKANQFLLERDSELIQSYVVRHQWDMKVTPDGLWYVVYKNTDGKKIKNGDIVRYNYTIELLDGTLCYSSDKDGVAQIKIGNSGMETGLGKGFLMMRTGEKARFILPPYLAYGLIGDMKKIPARSALVYDIEVIEIVDF